jgi:hypothetical protein
MKAIAALIVVTATILSGCASTGSGNNPYERYYNAIPFFDALPAQYFQAPPSVIQLERTDDMVKSIARVEEDGALFIGELAMTGTRPDMYQVIALGQKHGAAGALVMIKPLEKRSGVQTITTPNYSMSTGNVMGNSGGGTFGATGQSSSIGYTTQAVPYEQNIYAINVMYYKKASGPEAFSLGASVKEVSQEDRQLAKDNRGVYVAGVVRGSNAFKANILPGDVIVRVEGRDIFGRTEFTDVLTEIRKDEITIDVRRGGEVITVTSKFNKEAPLR